MMYSKTTSSASRSKKWPGPASPSSPRSMMRKNGLSAVKSSRPAMGAFMMTVPFLPLLPGYGGPGGELGERDRRHAGHLEDVAVGLSAVAAGDGSGEWAQDLGVLGWHASGNHGGDPRFAVGVPAAVEMSCAASAIMRAWGPVGA